MCTSLVWGLTAPFLAILMGLSGIIISAYMYSQYDFTYLLTTNVQYGMVVLLTVFSCVSLAAGCLGICAVYQYSKGMLTGFWVMMAVCLVGFAVTAAVGLSLPLTFYSEGCLSNSYPGIGYINNQTTLAINRFCKESPLNCTCYLKPNTSVYESLSSNSIANSTNNYTYPISVLECGGWMVGFYDNELAAYENVLNCAGWCSKHPYYLFSDINRGIPQDSCFNALAGWFKNYAELAYISGFVFVAICLCLIIWMCTYQFFCIREDVEYFTAVSATMIV